MMDNARIHRTNKVTKLIKDLKLIVFTIPPYSPELNKIENTFGIIKNKLSFKNLNIKPLAISNRRDKEYEEIIVTYSRFHKRIKY